jgi:DNA-directed RNA polymerase specialized sigma subunit
LSDLTTNKNNMNTKQIATLMEMLGKTATVAQLVTKTRMTRQTIYKALRALESSKVARITDWMRDDTGRAVEPVWALGSEPSEPRRKHTNAQKQKLYRERRKKQASVMRSMLQQIVATRPTAPESKATK